MQQSITNAQQSCKRCNAFLGRRILRFMLEVTKLHEVWDHVLDLLFPPRCVGCGARGAWFCTRCVDRCVAVASETNLHSHARLGATPLTSSAGVFVFASPLREAIHALKYDRRQVLARPLAKLIVARYRTQLPVVDAIVAVPLFDDRLKERGFNQSELLARGIAKELGLPLLHGQLVRTRATDHQAHLGRGERRENVKDAFSWCGPPPPSRLLLFDDVLTTGATLEACAAALHDAGVHEIHGLALARSGS